MSGWLWAKPKPKYLAPSEAAHHPALRAHFQHMLAHTDPPASFKASEVAQMLSTSELESMGYEKWEEVMPAMLELAWEFRELGGCERKQKGKVLGDDVDMYEVQGGFRIRRTEVRAEDDWGSTGRW